MERTHAELVKTEYKDLKPEVQDRGYAGGRSTGRIHMRVITSLPAQVRAAVMWIVNIDNSPWGAQSLA